MTQTDGFLTKRELVADTIRREILTLKLDPGAQLLQEEIAARLGVSPTPVREAFGILESEGLLESRPHRGVFVASVDYADLVDVYEVRSLLEGLALRRGADHARELAEKLIAVTDRSKKHLAEGDIELIRRTNNEFHQALIEDAGSRTLTEVTGKLVVRSLFFVPFELTHFKRVHADHVAIAQALGANRIERAVTLMTEHHQKNIDRLKTAKPAPKTAGKPGVLIPA